MSEKIEPWKYANETIEMVLHSWQCPECKETVLIYQYDDIENYKFCPHCGQRRYEDE